MASKTMRVLNIVSGVLLILIGIYCLCNQDIAAATAGLMVGIFMLASGIIEIVVFAATSRLLIGSSWLLLDGVLTVILSLFLLFNKWFTMLSLPFLFALWLLFSGSSRFVSAFDLKALGVRNWGWVYDGSVGRHNSSRYDGGACVPAGRRQFDYLCLYSENKITCWKQCSGAVYRTAKL